MLFRSRGDGIEAPQSLSLEAGVGTGSSLVVAGCRIEDGFDVVLLAGVELRLTPHVALRAGGRSGNEELLSVGLGVGRAGRLVPVVDVAWQWHPALGGSSFVTCSWTL